MAVDASLALIAMTQSIGAFQTFLPPLTEISRASPDNPHFSRDVRVGELAAAGLTIGVGAVVSSITGSTAPAIIAGITAMGMIVLYESTLRSEPSGEVTS